MKVFLDANVIYPNTMRGLFIRLHINRVIQIFWSIEVWDEVFRRFSEINPSQAPAFKTSMTINAISKYADCLVQLELFKTVGLPDAKDEHVVAAARQVQADLVITNDQALLDFNLSPVQLGSRAPDDFMMELVKSDKLAVVGAVSDQMKSLIKTRPKKVTYLESLRKNKLDRFAAWLEQQRGFKEVW